MSILDHRARQLIDRSEHTLSERGFVSSEGLGSTSSTTSSNILSTQRSAFNEPIYKPQFTQFLEGLNLNLTNLKINIKITI